MIFYSFEDPADIREPLHESLRLLVESTGAEFTRKLFNSERYRASGRYLRQLEETMTSADFAHSHHLQLHDGAEDALQTATVEYMLRTIHPDFKSKTPNYIYAELPLSIDRDRAWAIFRHIMERNCFCLGLANDVITGHHEKHSRSGALAAQQLRETSGNEVGFSETLGNITFRMQIAPGALFYGPTEYVAVQHQFASPSIEEAAEAVGLESTAAAHYFRATAQIPREVLWEHLRVAVVPTALERPLKYWKDGPWAEWYGRVSMALAT